MKSSSLDSMLPRQGVAWVRYPARELRTYMLGNTAKKILLRNKL